MAKFIDMLGRTCGRWTVLEKSSTRCWKENGRRRSQTKWLCRCSCGSATMKILSTQNLQRGGSCGCRRFENTSKRPFESIYKRLVDSANKRHIAVELTLEEYQKFAEAHTRCVYCWSTLRWMRHHNKASGMAHNMDRKEDHHPYSLATGVPCCTRCNRAKGVGRFTYAEWYEMTECFRRKVDYGNRSSRYKSL